MPVLSDTPCQLCRRPLQPTELRVCVACLGATRRTLALVTRLVDVVPHLQAELPPIVLDRSRSAEVEPPLPGGDLLVALGPGAPTGEGRPDDPWVVQQTLATWVRDWAETRSEATLPAASIGSLTGWLTVRAGWAAAHHDAFDDFAAELELLLDELAGWSQLRQPPVTGAPCPYCRVPLQRRWLDRVKRHQCVGHADRCAWPYEHHGCADTGGLEEDWRCPRCHRTYPDAHYWLAVRSQLEEVDEWATG